MATATAENGQIPSKQRKGDEIQDDEKTPLLKHNTDSGQNPKTNTKVNVAVCLVILVTELCERLAFYSTFTNLVPYCEDILKLPTPLPSQINLAFLGLSAFLPILGGWVADTYLGRFNTIYGSSLIYFVGCSLMALATYNYGDHGLSMSLSSKEVYLVIALLLIALGAGGIKANVSPFGADQVRGAGEAAVTRFFNWFYWFINVGAILSSTVVAYVQQEIAFFYGYLIAAICIFLASLIFLAGRKCYLIEPSEGSALSRFIKIVWHGLKTNCRKSKTDEDGTWLDRAKVSKGGKFSNLEVEQVKDLIPIFPIFLTYIVYWIVYSQMGTTFLRQGIYMKLKLGSFTVPAASLALFNSLVIILLIPILDSAVYPLLRYCGLKITPLKKIGVGMLIAVASMGVAGVVEMERKNFISDYGIFYQTPFNTPTNASSMAVLFQAPQFFLVGTSEVLVVVTGLEFAFSQSTKSLRGVVTGLFLAMAGIGNYMAAALVSIVRSVADDWYPEKLNTGSLEKYFFLLTVLMLLDFLVYYNIAIRYKYVASEDDHLEDEIKDPMVPNSRK